MQVNQKRCAAYVIVLVALTLNIFVWHAVLVNNPDTLCVSFLSVGEGNAILLQSPTGTTVLIDGGPDHAVLRALGSILGPLDRTLAVVVETNTNTSNAGGLPEIFDRYHVKAFISAGMPNSTVSSRMVAMAAAHEPGLVQVHSHRGMRIMLGSGAYVDVLFPDRDVSGVAASTGSLVLRVVYGKTSFMLPSSAPPRVQHWLATLDASTSLASGVLAVGHFGAKDSVDSAWLSAVHPKTVVISVGQNPYGYPSSETLTQLTRAHARVATTQASGTVTFTSDGNTVRRK